MPDCFILALSRLAATVGHETIKQRRGGRIGSWAVDKYGAQAMPEQVTLKARLVTKR